jgi:Tfp pilus assembly protein PilV
MRKIEFKTQNGFSTIEVLVASAILILALTGVILVSATNQSVISDSQTSNEALDKAEALLENEQSLPFAQIGTQTGIDDGSVITDGIYSTRVEIVTPWNGDVKIKQINVIVEWTTDHQRPQKTKLSALVTDYKSTNP